MPPIIGYHVSDAALDKESVRPGGPGPKGPKALGLWLTDRVHPWQASYGTVHNRVEIEPGARVLDSSSRALGDAAHAQHGGDWGRLSLALQADHDVVVMRADEGDEIVVLSPAAIASIQAA